LIYFAINCENPFLDDVKLSLFEKIRLLFGINIFKNLVITFTNWSFLKRHENLRFKQQKSQSDIISHYCSIFED